MNNTGWICLHRDILNWEWWDDRNTRDLFITCLLMANHEDVRWQGQVVKRGTFVTTMRNLAEEAGLSVMQMRTALNNLKITHEITQQSTHEYSIITITNYAKYQDKKNEDNTPNNTPNNTPITHEQHTNNTRITHNNNITIEQNNISTTTAGARIYNNGESGQSSVVGGQGSLVMKIEDLAQEYAEEIWMGGQSFMALHRLTKKSAEELVQYLARFNDVLTNAQVTHKTRGDYRHHFLSFVTKRIEIENKQQSAVTGGQKKENEAVKRLHNVGDFDFEGVRSDF